MSSDISVFLVDDDSAFRNVYRRLFSGLDGFKVLGEAASGREALDKLVRLEPDVAVVDVQMPGGDGLDLLRRAAGLRTRIVILTTFDLEDYVAAALNTGASGFLLKNASAHEVVASVRAAHAGFKSLAPEVATRLIDQVTVMEQVPAHPFSGARLSTRELQVVRLVGEGKSNQEISEDLHISLPTVRTYLSRLFAKLDVRSRTQLAVSAHLAGLLYPRRGIGD